MQKIISILLLVLGIALALSGLAYDYGKRNGLSK